MAERRRAPWITGRHAEQVCGVIIGSDGEVDLQATQAGARPLWKALGTGQPTIDRRRSARASGLWSVPTYAKTDHVARIDSSRLAPLVALDRDGRLVRGRRNKKQ